MAGRSDAAGSVYLRKEDGLSDRQVADRLEYDRKMRWLVGLPPLGEAPSRSSLGDFRRHLLSAEREQMAASQQAEWIAASELVDSDDSLIMDATH